MRTFAAVGFLILALNVSPAYSAQAFEDLTGADWAGMSAQEKEVFVYTGIGGLEREGAIIMNASHFYIEALDKVLAADEELKKEYLEDLFVFCVYESEQQARTVIDKIRKKTPLTPV